MASFLCQNGNLKDDCIDRFRFGRRYQENRRRFRYSFQCDWIAFGACGIGGGGGDDSSLCLGLRNSKAEREDGLK